MAKRKRTGKKKVRRAQAESPVEEKDIWLMDRRVKRPLVRVFCVCYKDGSRVHCLAFDEDQAADIANEALSAVLRTQGADLPEMEDHEPVHIVDGVPTVFRVDLGFDRYT